jgi:hypothetical protein
MRKLLAINLPVGILSLAISLLYFEIVADRLPLWLNAATSLLIPLSYYLLLTCYPTASRGRLRVALVLYVVCLLCFLVIVVLFFVTIFLPGFELASPVVFLIFGFQLIDSVEHLVLKVVDGQMRLYLNKQFSDVWGGALLQMILRNYRWLRDNNVSGK